LNATRRWFAAATVGLALAGAPAVRVDPAAAQASPTGGASDTTAATLVVTRRQAIDSALAHNPSVRAGRETVAEARARAVQGAAFPDPSLTGELSGQQSAFRPGTYTDRAVAVGLDLPFPTKFLLARRVGQADIDATTFSYDELRQQTAAAAAHAYDGLLVAELRHRQLTEALELTRSFLAKTEARAQAGTTARLDVIKARVEVAAARNDLLANGRDLADARAELNRQMGRALGAGVEAADSLTVPGSLPGLDALLRGAAAVRPALRSLDRERAGARATSALAHAFWLPDLSLSVEKDLSNGAPSSYTTDLGLSVPLFFWNHTRGEVAEASHRQRELDAAYRDAVAAVAQEVRSAYTAAITARRQAGYLQDELVPEARRAFQIASTSYGIGGSSSLEVIDARRTLLEAEGQLADALGAANDARADLELAVGTSLERVSSLSPTNADTPSNGDSHE
jgi:cobalt-zinc-cadmium efflux system outer membrane protein